jgi:hypothetical protein
LDLGFWVLGLPNLVVVCVLAAALCVFAHELPVKGTPSWEALFYGCKLWIVGMQLLLGLKTAFEQISEEILEVLW